MTAYRLVCQGPCLAVALMLVTVATPGTAAAQVGINAAALHEEMFGDYGPLYVLTGKPPARFVNGKRVVPKEGWFSSSMRNMAGKVHKRRGDQPTNSRASSGGYTRLGLDNLLLDVPHGDWAQRTPKWREQNALTLYRKNPKLIVSARVDRVGVEAKSTNRTMLAKSQEEVRSQLPNGQVLPGVQKLSSPNLEGVSYNASSTDKTGAKRHYAIWLATRNGYNYSLAVSGDLANHQAVDQTMQQFVSRLRQKQPELVARRTQPQKKKRGWW
ncbi:MAG: hypothetical protein AAFV43_01795 [Planctomycetota bacterium]